LRLRKGIVQIKQQELPNNCMHSDRCYAAAPHRLVMLALGVKIMKQLICDAIQSKTVLNLTYGGVTRTCEPHLLGYDSTNDLTLSAWQLSPNNKPGWRDFHISKASDVSITADFRGRPLFYWFVINLLMILINKEMLSDL